MIAIESKIKVSKLKCVAVLISKPRSIGKVATEPIQLVPIEIQGQSIMKSETHDNVKQPKDEPVDQCEEQNYCSPIRYSLKMQFKFVRD